MGERRGYLGFGFHWHWGGPNNPLELVSDTHRTTISGEWSKWTYHQPVERWYGISRHGRWGFMLMKLSQGRTEREPCPPPEFTDA